MPRLARSLCCPLLLCMGLLGHAQTSYIIEQVGRDAHQIVQSLGAFVGNERAESQSFDITYMPPGNGVEGVLIINTADYRATFKIDPTEEVCQQILLDTRSPEFLDDFRRLFTAYPTEPLDTTTRSLLFGDRMLRIQEVPSHNARKHSYVIQ